MLPAGASCDYALQLARNAYIASLASRLEKEQARQLEEQRKIEATRAFKMRGGKL